MPKEVEECVRSVLEDNPSYTESRAWAICNAQMKGETDSLEVHEMSEIGLEDEHLEAVDGWEQKEDGIWSNNEEGIIVYKQDIWENAGMKGMYEGYTLGTDGDPGDEEAVNSFLDALESEGADIWQVRNGELFTWPEDSESFPIHDPSIKVVGIDEETLQNVLDRFNVDFMSMSEGV